MRNTITRTITTTTINSAIVEFVNGECTVRDLDPITVHGTLSQAEAHKITVKKYGKGHNIVVKSLNTIDNFYEISVADFIKYAHVVEKPTEDETEN